MAQHTSISAHSWAQAACGTDPLPPAASHWVGAREGPKHVPFSFCSISATTSLAAQTAGQNPRATAGGAEVIVVFKRLRHGRGNRPEDLEPGDVLVADISATGATVRPAIRFILFV